MFDNQFERFIQRNIEKDTLRFITCGSVDDGKSTLIGRLLFDSHKVYEDQLAAVTKDSKKYGTQGDETDLALLLDGLQSEREQKITIDVAYRYFSTDKRKFIIADCPGHEQYTRNMVTGASTADAAIVLIDARKGPTEQTWRHLKLLRMLSIHNVAVAVNKMDIVNYDEKVFTSAVQTILYHEGYIDSGSGFRFFPVSALHGDNVVVSSTHMPWYSEGTLLSYLETLYPDLPAGDENLRLPIQYVIRPNQNFRGYSGTIASGTILDNGYVMILPQRELVQVRSLTSAGEPVKLASQGESVVVTIDCDLDLGRGNMLVANPSQVYLPGDFPFVSRGLEATVVWMHETPANPNTIYEFKIGGTQEVLGLIDKPLKLNEIDTAFIQLQTEAIFDTYTRNRTTGSFIIIDRITNATVGAGVIRQEKSAYKQTTTVTKEMRAERHQTKPRILWFTGLSGAGKTTIANALEVELFNRGYATYLLDGDNLRLGLNKDLDFTPESRTENIRRAGEVAKLFVDAGHIVLCAFISPYERDRELVRSLVGPEEFVEIYVSTSFSECAKRDTKGLYAKDVRALRSYEVPQHPDIVLDTEKLSLEDCVNSILSAISF